MTERPVRHFNALLVFFLNLLQSRSIFVSGSISLYLDIQLMKSAGLRCKHGNLETITNNLRNEFVRIAIIGGGAAGFFGAISAATHAPEADIVLYEATQKPLAKVRISGGGRCNVTHHCFDPAELCKNYPRGARELRGPFSRFQPRDTVEWFEEHGVRLKSESDGRMFPVSDDSETIVSCLIQVAKEKNINIQTGARIRDVFPQKDRKGGRAFIVTLNDGREAEYDKVLVATGSAKQGYRFAEALGHGIVPCVPSLFTFKVADSRLHDLAGVSFNNVSLVLNLISKTGAERVFKQSGPLLITHWGLSGPAVLKLSAWGARELYDNHYTADLTVNFLPRHNERDLLEIIRARKNSHPKKHVSSDNQFASDAIPNRYWKRIAEISGADERTTWASITGATISMLIAELRQAQFVVRGKGIFKDEFVTCGGVKLSEVDFRTMQSKTCPGLFFAGEILDIDGITGGFNFQNAWTTGWLAGSAIASEAR